MKRGAAPLWGALGIGLLFAYAIVRLGGRGVAAVARGLSPPEWTALLLLCGLFVWGEGHRALARRWVPWVMGRLRRLHEHGSPTSRLLAPLHAMGLIGASPGTLARAWTGTAAIGAAVALVTRLPEPWRGIVDAAVAAALLWGLGALVRAVAQGRHRAAPDAVT